jgi:hypothetical protein
MNRVFVFYTAVALWLAGFGLAALTAGGAGAVAIGDLGLIATLACAAARIGADGACTGRVRNHDRNRRWPR